PKLAEACYAMAGEIIDQVGPVFESRVVGDACLKGHCLKGSLSRQLATGNVFTGLAKFDHFGCSLEPAHLAQTRHILTVAFHFETERSIWIEAIGLWCHACDRCRSSLIG